MIQKYEVAVRCTAGLSVWMCGWYQGEEAWNNDAPAIEAPSPMAAADAAVRQAMTQVSIRSDKGEAVLHVDVRSRDETGYAAPPAKFKATVRIILSGMEVRP